MTTTAESLVELVAQLLGQRTPGAPPSYPTNAKQRVYAPRDFASFDNEYPAIFVSCPSERKTSLGNTGAPEYEVTATLELVVRDSAVGNEVTGAGQLLITLGVMKRQIETGLINNPALMVLLEKFGDVRSQTAYKASGERHLGEMKMELEVEFYQGPEDFYVITGAPLSQVTLSTPYLSDTGEPLGFSVTFPEQ